MKINEVLVRPGFWKGVAKGIVPNTIADRTRQSNAFKKYPTPPPPQPKPVLPIQVTTPTGIKVIKTNGTWVRQDDNSVVTDPTEIERLENLAKNARILAKARGASFR